MQERIDLRKAEHKEQHNGAERERLHSNTSNNSNHKAIAIINPHVI